MEENVTYPRTQKELVCIMEKAGKEGRLLETILDEFAAHPFHMPALWACRSYLHQLDAEACRSHPALPPLLALLSAMEGDLAQAREYVRLLGEAPSRRWKPQDFREQDYYRIYAELVMPYTSDGMFLRIVFFLVKTGMVPVRSLTLSASRPSILNGFRALQGLARIWSGIRIRYPRRCISCMAASARTYTRSCWRNGAIRITIASNR